MWRLDEPGTLADAKLDNQRITVSSSTSQRPTHESGGNRSNKYVGKGRYLWFSPNLPNLLILLRPLKHILMPFLPQLPQRRESLSGRRNVLAWVLRNSLG